MNLITSRLSVNRGRSRENLDCELRLDLGGLMRIELTFQRDPDLLGILGIRDESMYSP